MEREWNRFIKDHAGSLFFLSGFVRQFMDFNQSRGWNPTVLVFSAEDNIVGIASVITTKKFGVRVAKPLFNPAFSPEFVFSDQYRETCIAKTFEVLFDMMHCRFVCLTLPEESPDIVVLKRESNSRRIQFFTRPEMGHCVLPVKSTWLEFERTRGRDYVRKFKRIERNLSRVGRWKVACYDLKNEGSQAIKKTLDIEKKSWKEGLRTQMGKEVDLELMMILEGAQHTAKTERDFKCNIWFLELDCQTLAYLLVIQYKGVAYFVKSSYDERYRSLAPGLHVVNMVCRELFDRRQVAAIDFLTDLPFMEIWKPLHLSRVRAGISRERALYSLAKFALTSKPVKSLGATMSKWIPILDLVS